MLVHTFLIFFCFSLQKKFSLMKQLKVFFNVCVLSFIQIQNVRVLAVCSSQKIRERSSHLRASYSAEGDSNGAILWGTCLGWGLWKVSRQAKVGLNWGGICYYRLGVQVSQVLSNKCIFSSYQGPILSVRAWYSCRSPAEAGNSVTL